MIQLSTVPRIYVDDLLPGYLSISLSIFFSTPFGILPSNIEMQIYHFAVLRIVVEGIADRTDRRASEHTTKAKFQPTSSNLI